MSKSSITGMVLRLKSTLPWRRIHAPSTQWRGHATVCKRRNYTPDEDEMIVKFLKAGHSYSNIADALDRHPSSVQSRFFNYLRHREDAQCLRSPPRKPSSEMRNAEIQRLKEQEGLSISEIARRLALCERTVYYGYGMVRAPKGTTYWNYSEAEVETIASGLRQGSSVLEISKSLGCGRTSHGVAQCIRGNPYLRTLRPPASWRFTPAEDQAIRAGMIDGTSLSKLAKQLQRPRSSIASRLRLLEAEMLKEPEEAAPGINLPTRKASLREYSPKHEALLEQWQARNVRSVKTMRPWRPEEVTLLQAGRAKDGLSWDDLAKLLPGRTAGAIFTKYSRLNPKDPSAGPKKGHAPPAPARP